MKPWYRSKTFGVNVVIVGLAYWFRWSTFYVDPMWFVWLIAAANIVLRLTTRHQITWRHTRRTDP